MLTRTLHTQFGALILTQSGEALVGLGWGTAPAEHRTDLLDAVARQLAEYDHGARQTFDVPLWVSGSVLQQAVCDAMRAIPFGHTVTYGDIAKAVGASAQAVGQACGANPLPILIPCLRVMGAGGKLTGFSGAGGVETKVALLRHERAAGLLI